MREISQIVDEHGVSKGTKQILTERGSNTSTHDMRIVLSFHDDFVNENTLVEHFIIGKGHKCLFLPKFH